jgi:hypothetical protein
MMTRTQLLYLKLAEECAEVTQRVSKIIQFGPNDKEPGCTLDNLTRLHDEVSDLIAVIAILREERLLPEHGDAQEAAHIELKRQKINRYLTYSQELGQVSKRQ